jgi:hypothetical protein
VGFSKSPEIFSRSPALAKQLVHSSGRMVEYSLYTCCSIVKVHDDPAQTGLFLKEFDSTLLATIGKGPLGTGWIRKVNERNTLAWVVWANSIVAHPHSFALLWQREVLD